MSRRSTQSSGRGVFETARMIKENPQSRHLSVMFKEQQGGPCRQTRDHKVGVVGNELRGRAKGQIPKDFVSQPKDLCPLWRIVCRGPSVNLQESGQEMMVTWTNGILLEKMITARICLW